MGGINLPSNNLTGTIPPDLGTLQYLDFLGLDSNQLTGPIPPELGGLPRLLHLWLKSNELTGTIPPELGNIQTLDTLELYDNQLTGRIPPELGNLTRLYGRFTLAKNQLTGPIPPELGNLRNVVQFDLFSNQITGTLPTELGNLTNVRGLLLDYNQLTGPIPSSLASLPNLTSLHVHGNQLTGGIPPEFGNSPNLEALFLGDNHLTGVIPKKLGENHRFQLLELNQNELTGSIPSELGNLVNLEVLELSSNPDLHGPLPKTFLSLGLNYLNFSNTDVCVPAGERYQDWLNTIPTTWQSGITCKGPVLLIHGYCSSSDIWDEDNFRQKLTERDFVVETMDFPKPSNGNIWGYGIEVGDMINSITDFYQITSDDKIDIVAHSMGGLATRAYAFDYPGERRVHNLIMLGTPNDGSGLLEDRNIMILIGMSGGLLRSCITSYGDAARQMTPGSLFLEILNVNGLQPSIDHYFTIAGSRKWVLTQWLLRSEPNDGVVEAASVWAPPGTTEVLSHVDHFEYYRDPGVLNDVVQMLEGTRSDLAISKQASSYNSSDYQESALITGTVSVGQQDELSIPIDPTVGKVRFLLASDGGALYFTLTTPGGAEITPGVAAGDPAITYTQEITSLLGYEVNAPQSGNWIPHVAFADTVTASIDYALYTVMNSDLRLTSLMNSSYFNNNIIKLIAQLTSAGTPQLGANVEARIRDATGIPRTLSLYDDGSHGDVQANDGIYTAELQPEVGSYEVTFRADGIVQGQAFIRETAVMVWVTEPEYLFGDVNVDGAIDIIDIQLVASHWGQMSADPGWNPVYDLNQNDIIDVGDVVLVGGLWNQFASGTPVPTMTPTPTSTPTPTPTDSSPLPVISRTTLSAAVATPAVLGFAD